MASDGFRWLPIALPRASECDDALHLVLEGACAGLSAHRRLRVITLTAPDTALDTPNRSPHFGPCDVRWPTLPPQALAEKFDNVNLDPTVWASRFGSFSSTFAQTHPAGFVLVDFGLFAIGVTYFLFEADIAKWREMQKLQAAQNDGYSSLDEGGGLGGGFLSKVAQDPDEVRETSFGVLPSPSESFRVLRNPSESFGVLRSVWIESLGLPWTVLDRLGADFGADLSRGKSVPGEGSC